MKTDLLTSFETIEHFENPKNEFENIFMYNPKMFLLTTSIYKKQKQNWEYFEYVSGQHIFFYSKKAIEMIGKKYNYEVFFLECGFTIFLSKKFKYNKFKLFLLRKIFVREKFLNFLRLIRIFIKSKGYKKDYFHSKKF